MAEGLLGLLRRLNAQMVTLRQRFSRRTQRWIELGLNLFLLAIVALIIYQNGELLPILGRSLSLVSLVSCLGLYLLSLILQAVIWIDLMGYHSGERRLALADYVQTTLMGRLPGGLWKWFGRVTVYRAAHLSTSAILLVSLIELLLLLLTAGLLIALLFPMAWYWRLLAVALQLLLVGAILWRFTPLVPGLQRRFIVPRILSWGSGYMIAWGCGALILYLLAQPFSQVPLDLVTVLRLTCVSGVVNLLFQILPVSLLFRDLTLLALLGPFMSSPQAIVVIFALRIVSSICELLSSWILIAAARLFPVPPATMTAPTDQAL